MSVDIPETKVTRRGWLAIATGRAAHLPWGLVLGVAQHQGDLHHTVLHLHPGISRHDYWVVRDGGASFPLSASPARAPREAPGESP